MKYSFRFPLEFVAGFHLDSRRFKNCPSYNLPRSLMLKMHLSMYFEQTLIESIQLLKNFVALILKHLEDFNSIVELITEHFIAKLLNDLTNPAL